MWMEPGPDGEPYPDPVSDPEGFKRKVMSTSTWATRIITDNIFDIHIEDLVNPYNRFRLLEFPHHNFLEWLGHNRLLATRMMCETNGCTLECNQNVRSSSIDGWSWRCRPGGAHEHAIRRYSIFSHSHLLVQDIFLFICSYAERNGTLRRLSIWTGIDYSRTAVDWAAFIRDCMVQYVYELLTTETLGGEVEIDESQFGRKVKGHKGCPKKGKQVWVIGLVQRAGNKLLLLPVDDRSKATIHPMIQRYVGVGSKVYTDGWAAYGGIQELGYDHFTVNHKHSFRVDYQNVVTGEVEKVSTNRIEGAWKHAKV